MPTKSLRVKNDPKKKVLTVEKWDLYDKDRIRTGETIERGAYFPPDRYRVVVHLCIIGSDGKMLIQQRQKDKSSWANLWDLSVGGHIVSGETSQQGIQRELLEELGLSIDMSEVRPSLTMNFNSGFDDIYIIRRDIDISALTLQESEVQAVKFADCEEILSMIDDKTFIPYHKNYISLLFDLKDYMGVHKK